MRGVLVTLAVLFLTGTSEQGSGDGGEPRFGSAPCIKPQPRAPRSPGARSSPAAGL